MNAGLIVGYITQPNGMPIGGAEVWISAIEDVRGNVPFDENSPRETLAKTNARGYFQLPFAFGGANVAEIFGGGGRLNIAFGTPRGARKNSGGETDDKNFRVTGYLVKNADEEK